MKNLGYMLLLVSLILTFSACTLHFPYEWEWDLSDYRIILKVEPEDSQVMLNGKWIGEAYEFSSWDSALRLSSRNNELVIKKEGFVEEVIDLNEYNTRKIIIRLKLLEDKDYKAPAPGREPVQKVKPAQAEKNPEYKAKTVAPKELPPVPKEEQLSTTPIEISIDIQPEETSLYLNGKFWGISPPGGKIKNLRLVPGKYTIEAMKPGYKAYKMEFEVKDKPLEFIIKLEKI